MPKQPFLSIITVTYNDLNGFMNTYKSIINFIDNDIEWIIKDGGSEEKILKIIKKVTTHKKIKLISSKDSGTYNAMNQALNFANGNWLIFMNGGDTFNQIKIVNKIESFVKNKKLNSSKNNIILGNYNLIYKFGKRNFVRCKNISHCRGLNSYRMPTCHQAQLFSKSIYSNLRYREDLAISADHAYFWEALNNGAFINYLDEIICDFKTGGKSYKENIKSISDVYFSLKNIQKINRFIIIIALIKRFFAYYFILLHELLILKLR